MLQQTRVETVIPYYQRFLERFPDVYALARADEEEVLHAWSGLGYYARARNLKRAAEIVADRYEGALPQQTEALRELPGVGRYTVGALQSIAFDQPSPIVDGNIKRVFARWLAEPELEPERHWQLAEQLVRGSAPADFNQALMELGALICTPRSPTCLLCPVHSDCEAAALGDPESFPRPRPKKRPLEVSATAGVLFRKRPRAALLMLRRPSEGLLGGLWELPSCSGVQPVLLEKTLLERLGLQASTTGRMGSIRHTFSHRALTLELVRLELNGGRLRQPERGEARWVTPTGIEKLALSTLMKKVLARIDSR